MTLAMDEQMNNDVYYELKWDEYDNITDEIYNMNNDSFIM